MRQLIIFNWKSWSVPIDRAPPKRSIYMPNSFSVIFALLSFEKTVLRLIPQFYMVFYVLHFA